VCPRAERDSITHAYAVGSKNKVAGDLGTIGEGDGGRLDIYVNDLAGSLEDGRSALSLLSGGGLLQGVVEANAVAKNPGLLRLGLVHGVTNSRGERGGFAHEFPDGKGLS